MGSLCCRQSDKYEFTSSSDGSEDPTKKAAAGEDRFYNNKAFEKNDIDVSNTVQQEAATSIQSKYRQHHATQVVQEKREERAATTIQASYRGFQDRQKVKTMKNGTTTGQPDTDAGVDLDLETDGAAKTKEMMAEGYKSREKAGNVKEEIDMDLDDPEMEKAAICIQAQYKGYKTRKEIGSKGSKTETEDKKKEGEEEEIDIDLNDPEVEAAAIKIQAGFKDFKARKSLKNPEAEEDQTETKEATKEPEEEVIDIDLEDPEVEAAAIKIQASFKGFKARKEMKENSDDTNPTDGAEKTADNEGNEVDKVDENVKENVADETKTDNVESEDAKKEENVETKEENADQEVKNDNKNSEEKEEIDIDLNDPEVEDAAIKIQAGFKNYKKRQSMKGEAEKEQENTTEDKE